MYLSPILPSSSFIDNLLNIALLVVGIFAVLSYFFLTRLFKIEHDDFYTQWQDDGKPHGMPFWFPMKELGELGSRSYPWFMGTLWLFKTPSWLINHEKAKKMFRYFRFTSYVAYGMLVVMFLLVSLSLPR